MGGVARSPELVAVPLIPIARRVAAIGGLPRGCRLDPRGWDQLPAVPVTVLQVQLAELGNIFRANAQPVGAECDPLRAGAPGGVCNAQRLEQTGTEIVEHGLAGHLLNDGRLHVSARRVGEKVCARLMRDRLSEESLHPTLGLSFAFCRTV